MVYINNIYTGLLVFPFIAAVFTMPYAIYQYNRYGSVSKLRTLIIYSFILYMLIAFFMVSLPLPDRASTVGNRWQDHLNLIPCRQIWLYWRNRAFNLREHPGIYDKHVAVAASVQYFADAAVRRIHALLFQAGT